MAKPVIATNIPGNAEIISDGINGLLVPAENPGALSEAIMKLVENPDMAKKIGREARNQVEVKYSIIQNKKNTESIYEKFISKKLKIT